MGSKVTPHASDNLRDTGIGTHGTCALNTEFLTVECAESCFQSAIELICYVTLFALLSMSASILSEHAQSEKAARM